MSSQDHDPCQRCLRYHPPGAPCGRIEYLAPDSHEACRAEAVTLRAQVDRLSRLNGRRERHILRARLQEAGAPVTPEWLGNVERIYPEARVTQRLCSALRRAWDERDKARAVMRILMMHFTAIRDDAPMCSAKWEDVAKTAQSIAVAGLADIRAALGDSHE